MSYKTLITEDRLISIIILAGQVPQQGLFAELGVYKGGSIKYLAERYPKREIIGFDTFTGLPKEQWSKDEIHKPKDFDDNSLEEVKEYLKEDKNVKLVKGLFPDSAKDYQNSKFAFVHVDLDFYLGTKAALDFFRGRMLKGGIIVFDDYGWENCPGVAKALREEFGKQVYTNPIAKNQAYFIY